MKTKLRTDINGNRELVPSIVQGNNIWDTIYTINTEIFELLLNTSQVDREKRIDDIIYFTSNNKWK